MCRMWCTLSKTADVIETLLVGKVHNWIKIQIPKNGAKFKNGGNQENGTKSKNGIETRKSKNNGAK